MTPTEIALIAVHKSPAVPLEAISRKYLGMEPGWATKQAKRHLLPFPVFKMTKGLKSPFLVYTNDLAAHIDSQHEAAMKSWSHSQV